MLDHLTVIEYGNMVAESAGGQSVADEYRRFILDKLIEILIYRRFGNRIKCGRRFVRDHKRRILRRFFVTPNPDQHEKGVANHSFSCWCGQEDLILVAATQSRDF